jgi:transposase-like protein
LIGKHQRRVPGFDENILALYAKGMTTRDIQEIVRELYDVEVSATLVSEITADLDQEVTAWRTRLLEGVWPIVYFDGIQASPWRSRQLLSVANTALQCASSSFSLT